MSAEMTIEEIATVNRRETTDRRTKNDRRHKEAKVDADRRGVGERRQKVERRRQIDPTTCERDYTPDEIEFMNAMDRYRRDNGRPFPTWSEVLEVVRSIGYQKVEKSAETTPVITGV